MNTSQAVPAPCPHTNTRPVSMGDFKCQDCGEINPRLPYTPVGGRLPTMQQMKRETE